MNLSNFLENIRYITFLPNETQLSLESEDYVMYQFWNAANSTEDNVLFSEIGAGQGLSEARKKFKIEEKDEPYFILLDIYPDDWASSKIPIGKIDNKHDITCLLLSLVTAGSNKEIC